MPTAGIDQIREAVLKVRTEDIDARLKALGMLNDNSMLVGRVRANLPYELAQSRAVRLVAQGKEVDQHHLDIFTDVPRGVLRDDVLLKERLGLTDAELAQARPVFDQMIADLKG